MNLNSVGKINAVKFIRDTGHVPDCNFRGSPLHFRGGESIDQLGEASSIPLTYISCILKQFSTNVLIAYISPIITFLINIFIRTYPAISGYLIHLTELHKIYMFNIWYIYVVNFSQISKADALNFAI